MLRCASIVVAALALWCWPAARRSRGRTSTRSRSTRSRRPSSAPAGSSPPTTSPSRATPPRPSPAPRRTPPRRTRSASLPDEFDDAAYDDDELGAFAYRTASTKFKEFLGADESLAMRTIVSWAWFRPSEEAWDDGARWYRCDVVGGGDQTGAVDLPTTPRGCCSATRRTAGWCAPRAPTVSGSVKVPCTEKHDWRAVTTIVLGERRGRLPRRPPRPGHDPGLLLEVGRRLARTTPSTTTSATRGSTRPSGTPATAARSAGRRRVNDDAPARRCVAAVAALLAGCSAATSPTTARRRPRRADVGRRLHPRRAEPPAAEAADDRACYRLEVRRRRWHHRGGKPVPATETHTAVTFAVGDSTRWSAATCSPSTPPGCSSGRPRARSASRRSSAVRPRTAG